jgi:hypothetical protein
MAGLDVLVEHVRDLEAQLLARTEAAALWQARAQLLEERVAVLEEQLRALPAPDVPGDPPSGPRANGTTESTQEANQGQRRAWWRFW